MRALMLIAALICMSGCAALFQDHLDRPYDGRSEPRCSTSDGWPTVDFVFGALNLAGAITAIESNPGTDDERSLANATIVDGLAFTAIHAISGVVGLARAGDCSAAYVKWGSTEDGAAQRADRLRADAARAKSDNPKNDPDLASEFWCDSQGVCTTEEATCVGTCVVESSAYCAVKEFGADTVCGETRNACQANADRQDSRFGECVVRLPGRKAATKKRKPKVEPPLAGIAEPRGFFCTTSAATPNAGTCTREKAACSSVRDAAIAAVADLGTCALVETAQCVGERCFPSAEGCEAARARDAIEAACEERR